VKPRLAIPAAAIGISALISSGCTHQSGLGLARQACSEVQASISSYEAGIHATKRSIMARDLKRANDELQAAEPLAAAATSADGQWNALMTTLSEIGQVDEGRLITALRAQCAVADSNQPELPTIPTTSQSAPSTDHPTTSASSTTTTGPTAT